MSRQRTVLILIILIVVPAVVSFLVTRLVLYFWDLQQRGPTYITLPTYSSTAQVPPVFTQPPSPSETGGNAGEASAPEEAAAESQTACENPVHIVISGETLMGIAQRYGVSVDDITAMNRLFDPTFDPDRIAVDQQIIIPICGIPTLTPSLTPTDTLVPTRVVLTPIPTATPPPPGTVIVTIARVLNPGDVTTEAIEIVNEGSSVARMEGWTLTNGRGDEFVFPVFNLFPQGAVTVYTRVGENTPTSIYWGLDEAVWRTGDTVQLYDAEGNLQAEYEIVH